MIKIDKLFGYGMVGFIVFITFFCAGWWLCYITNSNFLIGFIISTIISTIINIIVLKKIVNKIYKLPYWLMALIYIFYTIGTFGLFMGVPIFNIFLGPIAGYYIGRRMVVEKRQEEYFKKTVYKTDIFCLVNLLVICVGSATIALLDKYTGANIKGMLQLSFDITKPMIWGIVIIGGLALLIIQHLMTKAIAYQIYKIKK